MNAERSGIYILLKYWVPYGVFLSVNLLVMVEQTLTGNICALFYTKYSFKRLPLTSDLTFDKETMNM